MNNKISMDTIYPRLAALGVKVPEILLPRDGVDLSKWAVIACDQFTQDRSYWEKVKNTAGGSPSCLNLIFPELYLEYETTEEKNRRIQSIKKFMASYISEGIFSPPRRCCVYLERSTPHNVRRRGIVLSVDLEKYDWAPLSRPLIRSTEGTVKERLPPRMEIRRDAPLELPHILLLIDDENDTIIPSLGETAKESAPLYETPLMMNSGEIKGWALDTEEALALLAKGLETLAERAEKRYGEKGAGESPFLFAVGDGNHSLATAKAVWDEYKKAHSGEEGIENHPARWALVEVENIYDSGIIFEPIHRIVFGIDPAELLEKVSGINGLTCRAEAAEKRVIRIESSSPEIATAGLQPLLDSLVSGKGLSIDYIHGEEEIFRIVKSGARQAAGLILPPVKKEGLFKTVAQTGPLPRKSFSMGEACEKRFYMECGSLFR